MTRLATQAVSLCRRPAIKDSFIYYGRAVSLIRVNRSIDEAAARTMWLTLEEAVCYTTAALEKANISGVVD